MIEKFIFFVFADVFAVDVYFSPVRLHLGRQQFHRGAFAGAVAADDAEELVPGNLDGNAFDDIRAVLFVTEPHFFQLHHGIFIAGVVFLIVNDIPFL